MADAGGKVDISCFKARRLRSRRAPTTFYNNCLRRVTSLKLHSPRTINVCHYRNNGGGKGGRAFYEVLMTRLVREIFPFPPSRVALHIYRFISNPAIGQRRNFPVRFATSLSRRFAT